MKRFSIILAAGNSTRMGTCKTSLPWGEDQTLLTYQLEQWLLAGFTPLVVLGLHNKYKQRNFPHGSFTIINPHSHLGKTISIIEGLKYIPADFEVLAISAVDQPRNSEIYRYLLQVHQENAALITAPIYKNQMGHPLLFSNEMGKNLGNIREETFGLRQVIKEFDSVINKVEFETPDVLIDINTPEVYQKVWHSQMRAS
jgi:molybdenum cofactor cytidylyltransferase